MKKESDPAPAIRSGLPALYFVADQPLKEGQKKSSI
jgi:hypothetical protein